MLAWYLHLCFASAAAPVHFFTHQESSKFDDVLDKNMAGIQPCVRTWRLYEGRALALSSIL